MTTPTPAGPSRIWTFDPAAYEIQGREQEQAEAMLMGRVSYEEFVPHWPSMADFARYNAMPKYVVSTTVTDADVAQGLAAACTLTLVEQAAYSNGIRLAVYDVVR